MGLRFRKSTKVGPVRFTVSPSGVSRSVGGKGYRRTKTASGAVRNTVSVPGTGVSYSTQSSGGSGSSGGKSGPGKGRVALYVILALIVIGALGGKGGDKSEQAASSPTPTAAISRSVAGDAGLKTAKADGAQLQQAEPTPSPTPRVYTYVVNTASGVFHRPGCSAGNKIADGNKQEVQATRQEMLDKGYDPCGRCNP